MKKYLYLAILMGLVPMALPALEISLEAGLSYTPVIHQVVINDPGAQGTASDYFDFAAAIVSMDAKFVQVALAYAARFAGHYDSSGVFVGSGTFTNRESFLAVRVLLEYPFALGPVLLLPLLGVESNLNVTYTTVDGVDIKPSLSVESLADLDAYFVEAGVAARFSLGGRLYLRPELLVGLKLPSFIDNDTVDYYETTYGFRDVTVPTFKVSATIIVGYRL